jgi:hypothetical protein
MQRLFGGRTLSLIDATTRITMGLREAETGCRQIIIGSKELTCDEFKVGAVVRML